MKKFILTFGTLLVLSTAFLATKATQKRYVYGPSFPGTPFEKNETVGLSYWPENRWERLTYKLENEFETTAMIILKNGEILYEYGDVEAVSYIASCRKSVLSMLFGKYIENGTIDLQETVGKIGITDTTELSDIEKTATVEDILSSRSGIFIPAANGGTDKDDLLERGSVNPGEYFVYNNWDFNVAGSIFEMKTGKSIYQELEEQLAIPLGFQDWNIRNQRKKYNDKKSLHPAYHIYLSTRDMAKIGQLMLNKGRWNDEQLIPEFWIESITSPVTSVDTVNQRYGKTQSSSFQFHYGFMWWGIDSFKGRSEFEGAYTAIGHGGQFITVIPKLDIVVVHKTKLGLRFFLRMKKGVKGSQYWGLLSELVQSRCCF